MDIYKEINEGIGYAVARALLTRGVSVVVTGTKQDKLTQAAVNLRLSLHPY